MAKTEFPREFFTRESLLKRWEGLGVTMRDLDERILSGDIRTAWRARFHGADVVAVPLASLDENSTAALVARVRDLPGHTLAQVAALLGIPGNSLLDIEPVQPPEFLYDTGLAFQPMPAANYVNGKRAKPIQKPLHCPVFNDEAGQLHLLAMRVSTAEGVGLVVCASTSDQVIPYAEVERFEKDHLGKSIQLGPRQESSLLRIVGAMHTLLMGEKRFTSEAQLIAWMAEKFPGNEGVSKRNLEKIFPRAKDLLNKQD